MADVEMRDAEPLSAQRNSNNEASDDSKKRFEVKKVQFAPKETWFAQADRAKWNAVALWAWDIVVDNCAICRNHIMDLCRPQYS